MNIIPVTEELHSRSTDALIVYIFEDRALEGKLMSLDKSLDGAISNLLELGDFTGASGQVVVLYPHKRIPAERVIVTGMGSEDNFGLETIRSGAANAILKVNELAAQNIDAHLPDNLSGKLSDEAITQAAVEGYLLALYDYAGQKTSERRVLQQDILNIVLGDEVLDAVEAGIKSGSAIAAGTFLARDLVNLPPNICNSIYMADSASRMGEERDLRVQVLDENQIAELKMGAFLGVARGSDTPPRLIVMEYNTEQKDYLDTIVLIGKGITFDTGGYNLKPYESQGTMKADMAGAAAVIGAMKAISLLEPEVHVIGLAPVVDNMISGRAYRQQEVVTASNGVTIEIGSTDAEGRMLLADALVYASRFNPAAVVDIATLTGASVIALGRAAASLFSTDASLREKLLTSAGNSGEKLWPMPFYPEYEKAIESDTADIKNTGGKYGGVGSSATFLKHFVSYPAWAHIDMAGLAMDAKDNPYIPKTGATGYGVRLLAEFVRRW
jgi:leucyl aminopeptidase